MLKTSEYNFIWPLEGSDKALIFNSFTAATTEIKKHQLDILKDKSEIELDLLDEEKKKTALELLKAGFLIEDFIDEKKVLRYRNSSGKFRKDTLAVTIAPTLDCNLKCFYCFQERNTDVMTTEIQEGIAQYVSESIKGAKFLKVCWFGGEPLLAWDIICSMTSKLMKIAEENGCEYGASMVSNGYLFDSAKIEKLKELKINMIQITLDGPPSVHCSRKGIKGNAQENFNKIIDIIRNIRQNDVKVSVRINIDKANKDYIEELLDILAASSFNDIDIYPAQVEPYTQVCSNVKDACLVTEEFVEVENRFYRRLLETGLQSDLSRVYPTLKGNFCSAEQGNSFAIGPNGYIYKCWNTIGNEDEMVSDVMKREWDEHRKKEMTMNDINWIIRNPFDFKECNECKVLPLCMGGCPYKALKKNKPDCITIKNNLKETVFKHYYCMKIKNIFQE